MQVTGDDDRRKMEEILQFMADQFPQITSLMYVINNKCNDTIGDLDVEVFKGNDHIFEEMEGLRFKVGPKSFYQTNSEQAYNLYKVAREFAGLTGNELVYDLYTVRVPLPTSWHGRHARWWASSMCPKPSRMPR